MLEHRARLKQVAHGMILDFPIFTVNTFLHVDNGLDVSGLHLHNDGYAHVAVNYLQFIDNGALSQVLHLHVDGGYDVGSGYRRGVYNVEKLIEHLAPVLDAVGTPEQ